MHNADELRQKRDIAKKFLDNLIYCRDMLDLEAKSLDKKIFEATENLADIDHELEMERRKPGAKRSDDYADCEGV